MEAQSSDDGAYGVCERASNVGKHQLAEAEAEAETETEARTHALPDE